MNDSYVSDAHVCPTVNGDAGPECAVPIDDLLDQAVAAINQVIGSPGRRWGSRCWPLME